MEVRPGYKQTDVGVIPEDWELKTVGDIGEAVIGLTYEPTDVRPDGILVLRSSNVQDGTLRFDDNVFVEMDVPDRMMARVGDILICVRNGSRGLIGKCALLDERAKGMSFGAFMAVLRTPGYEFVYHQFQSAVVRRQIHEHLGATINQITNNSLNSFSIPVPPGEPEQEAIAEALSDVDALIESLGHLISKKRDLRQGCMQALLTGTKRLPGFTGDWALNRIAQIASPTSEWNSGGEPLTVLTCSKHLGFVESLGYFRNQVFSRDTSRYKVIKRGQIGYPSNHVEEGSIGLQDLYDIALVSPIYVVFAVMNEEVDSYFLHRLLKLDAYRQTFARATSSSVDRRGSLRWPAFSEITVSLPSMDEQTAIASVLRDADAEIAALEAKLTKARQIKQGMMQELLTGWIRLI